MPILATIFWLFTVKVFAWKFDLPQIKWILISRITHFAYILPSKLGHQIVGNQGVISKMGGDRLVPSLPFKNQFLAVVVKTYAKADVKVFWICTILLDFFNCCQLFCPKL